MYECEAKEENSESEFCYPEDTISSDLFFTDGNYRSESQPVRNSEDEKSSFQVKRCQIINF